MKDQINHQQLDEGQNQGQNANSSDKGSYDQPMENMIPKARFDQINEKRKAAEAELRTVAQNLKEEIPAEHQDLIPDLPPAQLIRWLRSALKKGLFGKPPVNSIDVERPNKQRKQDLSGLNPMQMMSMGYGKK